ncbi:MAG TPA: carboxypeptidase regulatory-like domain-containing protein [Thermoanaerobaculia bacterium]|jgi:5-hydroxyisourate hydrolase-like protein (transthyretin family)|nr:carboxypeptidase regulatory-like domain-containing protein [Thermoanaerobaculia bacterium]
MRRWSTRFADAAAFIAACLLSLSALARTTELRNAGGAPVRGVAVVLATEWKPGPYEVLWSGDDGRVEIPPDFNGRLLAIHPRFAPQETDVVERITLREGDPVDVPETVRRQGIALRVYAMDWIGRFDVETLPAVKAEAVMHCGSEGTVFDLQVQGKVRTIARGAVPSPGEGEPVSQSVTIKRTDDGEITGVVFLAEGDPSTAPAVPRSRILGRSGQVIFEQVAADHRYVTIAAARGHGPVVRYVRAAGDASGVEVTPVPAADVTARVRCEQTPADLRARAQWEPREARHVSIPRSVELGDSGKVRVEDLAAGRVRLAVGGAGLREAVRDIVLAPDRMHADAGTICPGRPYVIKGVVVDEGRRTVSGVTVRYDKEAATTKSDGAFAISVTAPAEAPLSATREGYVTWKRWFAPTAVASTLRIELSRGTRFTGRVVDATTHAPLERFRLQFLSFSNRPERSFDRWLTAADGSFATPAVRRDIEQIILEADDHQTTAIDLKRVDDRSAVHDLGEIALAPLLRIKGRAVNDHDVPLTKVVVRARSDELPEWRAGERNSTLFEGSVDAYGHFELSVQPGTYSLTVRAQGFAPTVKTGLVVSSGLDVGTVALVPGCALRVHVIRGGQPVAKAPIELHRGTADDQADVITRSSDEDGWARFTDLASGDYAAVVSLDHRMAGGRTVSLDAGECSDDAAIEIDVGGVLVRGFATRGGRPITESTISLFPIAEEDSPMLTIVRERTDAQGRTVVEQILGKAAHDILATTDSTGFFLFEDVKPGSYRLTSWQGDAASSRPIAIPDVPVFDASTDFDAPPIVGDVTDAESGQPISGALVALEDARGTTVQRTTTDDAGRFELGSAPEEGALIRVSHADYPAATHPLTSDGQVVHLKLTRSALTFSGVLPTGGLTVEWQLETGVGRFGGSVLSEADGTFEIPDLKPGTLIVAVSSGPVGQIAAFTLPADGSQQHPLAMAAEVAVNVLVPKETKPDQLLVRVGGIDITPLLWRVAAFQPRPGQPSEWIWRLPAGVYELVLGGTAQQVDLRDGEKRISFRP